MWRHMDEATEVNSTSSWDLSILRGLLQILTGVREPKKISAAIIRLGHIDEEHCIKPHALPSD